MPPRRKNGRKKRTKRNTGQSNVISPSFSTFKATGLSDLIPASVLVTLRYTDPSVTRLATGTNWNLFSLRANDVFDPDVALLSAAVPGFTGWARFYQKWRVHKVHVEWEIVNLSNTPISLYANYANDINVIPASYAAAVAFADNPTSSRVKTVSQSATGFNKATIRFSFDLERQYGGPGEYMANETFVGNGGLSPASPGSRTFLNFIAFAAGTMTQGVYSRLRVTYSTRFFDRLAQTV